jgi:hypothetical protein
LYIHGPRTRASSNGSANRRPFTTTRNCSDERTYGGAYAGSFKRSIRPAFVVAHRAFVINASAFAVVGVNGFYYAREVIRLTVAQSNPIEN